MKALRIVGPLTATMLLAACDSQVDEPQSQDVALPEATTVEPVTTELTSLEARVSYLIGYNNAGELADQGLEIDAYVAGIRDQAGQRASRVPEEQTNELFTAFQQQLNERREAERSAAATGNLEASEAFLAENAAREDVMTTASGLQYRIVTAGDGPMPSADDTVLVHYEGKLIDGTVFDSSIARDVPNEFGVSNLIEGWTEALQLMSEGSTWELFIPPSLAYGENAPESIGPNQALIFEVRLLKADATAE